ncbi:uncharacterized protein LOC143564911 [Bidens hawaiensis]|uniref:uncharacterized protein LOC143564911 n=1 Tax=Bidens hawaiensis TaxID=980011 RepID=UPI0040494385
MAGNNEKELKGNEGIINHDSPYYIHPSGYPRKFHVNDVLTDGNYNDRKEEIQNFLFAKNKIGLVNGSTKKPNEDASDYMAWMRCDAIMIKGWRNESLEKEIRMSVKYAPTAHDIWADLKERFGKESAS